MLLTKKKIYLGIAALVALIIGLSIFLVYPMVDNIGFLSSQLEDEQLLLEKNNLKEQNLKDFKEKQDEIESKLDDMEGSMIAPGDNLEYILMLEKIAGIAGVKQSIKISNSTEEKNSAHSVRENEKSDAQKTEEKYSLEDLPHVAVEIQLEGKYKNILNYLLYFESLKIYSDIISLDIKLKSLEKLSAIDQKSIDKAEVGEEDIVKASFEARVFTNE